MQVYVNNYHMFLHQQHDYILAVGA